MDDENKMNLSKKDQEKLKSDNKSSKTDEINGSRFDKGQDRENMDKNKDQAQNGDNKKYFD